MLRLENVPPEEMPEVVRIASELYEQDKTKEVEAQERQATVEAAAEVGLPEEYLQRAAAELHARRVEQIERRQRRRVGLMATVGATAAIGLSVFLMSRITTGPNVMPPPPIAQALPASPTPLHYAFGPTQWNLNTSPGTQAMVRYESGTAVVRVEQFSTQSGYFVNLNTTDGTKNLSTYNRVSILAHGNGLPNIRLYLENGNQRWRSPLVPVSAEWQSQTLRFDQFDYQTRASKTDKWQKQPFRGPGEVERLSFKFGDYVNDANAKGEVALNSMEFKFVGVE